MKSFLEELRRRHVYRTFAAYVVGAWMIIQFADAAFDAFGVGGPMLRYLWLAALAGSPVALLFSWAYDLTPAGIVRTPARATGEAADLSLHLIDYVLLSALAAILVTIVYGVFYGSDLDLEQLLERDVPAIAVLPLEDLSDEGDLDKFARKTGESLAGYLGHIKELDVIATGSSFQFQAAALLPDIREALQADYLVEGSVDRKGDEIVVTARLIDASTGRQMWIKQFRGVHANLFTVQEDIAQQISDHLDMSLGDPQKYGGTTSFAAYEAADLAYGAEDLDTARQFYEEAIRHDPDFAWAHTEMAWAEWVHAFQRGRPLDEAWDRARPLLERAIAAAEEFGDAHTLMGDIQTRLGYYDEAEQALTRALEINPSDSYAIQSMARLYQNTGRTRQAVLLARRDVRINPLDWSAHTRLGNRLARDGQLEEAIRHHERAVELAPRSFAAWHDYVYSVATPTRGAIEGLRVIARMQGELGDPGGVGVADLMSNLFGWIGDYDRELRLLEYIGEQDPERDQAGMHAYLALEQKDYERALEEGWRGLASFANDHYTMAFVIRATRATDGSSARIREHVTQYVPTLLARSPALTGVQGPLAVDFALLLRGEGEEDQAQRILEAVVARGESSSSELPRALAHLGRTREAIAALDALVADGLLFNSGADADWGALEELPRFQELVARGDAMRAGQRAEVQAMIERGELLMPTGEVL